MRSLIKWNARPQRFLLQHRAIEAQNVRSEIRQFYRYLLLTKRCSSGTSPHCAPGLGAVDRYDRLTGTVTVDGINAAKEGAQLRWFVVSPIVQSQGIGQALMERVDMFLRERGYRRTFLTTFDGLEAAWRLYERFGFRLVAEEPHDPWSGSVGMQTLVRETP